MQKIKRIPYGIGAFDKVNARGAYYIDKTSFIPEVEETNNIFLIRPRRFGKSMFLSMLHSYYDINQDDDFERLFRDTWILENPTEERAEYMVLSFNFSGLDCRADRIEDSFNNYCNYVINDFVDFYKEFIDKKLIKEIKTIEFAHDKLARLDGGLYLQSNSKKIYVMIDEYDNFANTIISEERVSEYQKLMHASGIFKSFFSTLKKCSEDSGSSIDRMFITGVSPITMDDVTSGCNIGDFISTDLNMNEAFGFTLKDVHDILDYYIGVGKFRAEDKENSLEIMKKYYDSYKFSENAKTTMYNTCSVLNFMNKYFKNAGIISDIIDNNLRTDYKKLKHLIVINKTLNGNFDVLNTIISKGGISAKVAKSFPYEEIRKKDNFISLLYHLGFLTHTGISYEGETFLKVPNETIKSMVYGYIRNSLTDSAGYKVDMNELSAVVRGMAYRGVVKEVFAFIANIIKNQTSVRDYIAKEKILQGYFMAYMGVHDVFIMKSEMELNKGYADLTFIPFYQQYQDIKYACICEFKYFGRIKDFDNLDKDKQETELAKLRNPLIKKAEKQLAKYVNDDDAQKMMHTGKYGDVILKKHIVIFHGWELIYNEEYL